MATADNESRLCAMDRARRERNAQRRRTQTQEVDALESGRNAQLREFHARLAQDAEWRAYVASAEASSLLITTTPRNNTIVSSIPRIRVVPIDASSEAEVNTWLSLWSEKDATDLLDTLQDAQAAELIMRDMDRIAARAESSADTALSARLARDRDALREMQTQQIDRATAHIIQHADEHANSKNEVLLAYDTGDIKYCMWINLSKNPRVKTIEFADLNISVDIPKSLALASVAIRLIHYRYDNLSVGFRSDYSSIGGILHLDLLALPPPPKKVKGWTLRQVTPLATNIVRLPYPGQSSMLPPPTNTNNTHVANNVHTDSSHLRPSSSTQQVPSNPPHAPPLSRSSSSQSTTPTPPISSQQLQQQQQAATPLTSSAWAPISIAWPVPKDVMIGANNNGSGCSAGWWDADSSAWRLDAITHEFDPESRRICVQTTSPAPLALLYNMAQLYPLAAWELRPSSHERNVALLSIITRTGVEVEIQIGEGVCSLVLPDSKELSHLHGQKMDPVLLLKRLALSGLALNNKVSLPPGMVTLKNENLERETCRQISRLSQTFSFRHSPINQSVDPENCLFQVGTAKEDASEYPDQMEDWHTCHITPLGCHLLDKEPTSSSELFIDEEVANTHLVHCLEPLRPHIRSVVSSTSVALSECAENLMWSLGVFSYTA